MRVIVKDITTQRVYIGFEGEKNHIEFAYDFTNVFAEYPDATAYMSIKPPKGDVYPHTLTREDSVLVWAVNAADCAYAGDGEYQFTFLSGETIVKSFRGFYTVRESLTVGGEAPDPVAEWMTDAQAALYALTGMTARAETLAPDSEATAEIVSVDNHKEIVIGVPQGVPGQDGEDGVSPTIAVTDITDGHEVTITDATGAKSFDVMNGKKGDPGTPGDPTELIDDSSTTATDKVWSAKKSADEVSDLNQAINNKADIIISSASGSIASFPDGADGMPVKELTVGIEPVQDLHGYDHPWPAGGGENVVDFASYFTEGETVTQNGITATFSNGYLKVTGTNTSSVFNIVYKNSVVTLPAGTYIMPYNLNVRASIGGGAKANYASAITAESSVEISNFYVFAANGATVDYNIPMMLVKGTTRPTEYTPYSNICPITGWTGAKVTRTGKNLVDDSIKKVNGSRLLIGATTLYENPTYLKAGTYSITVFGVNSTFGYLMKSQYVIKTIINGINHGSFTVDNDGYYRIDLYGNAAISGDVTGVILVPGSTCATSYEPYQGQTYDIEFPSEAGTVYGGTLDVVSGEFVVDRVEVADLGTLSWAYNAITNPPRFSALLPYSGKNDPWWVQDAMLSTGGYTLGANVGQDGVDKKYGISTKTTYFTNTEYTNKDDFKASITGTQLVYRIATPITYTLTPQEIRTLLGTNNIWADTGDTSVTYKADTKLYIDNKITQAIAAALNA